MRAQADSPNLIVQLLPQFLLKKNPNSLIKIENPIAKKPQNPILLK